MLSEIKIRQSGSQIKEDIKNNNNKKPKETTVCGHCLILHDLKCKMIIGERVTVCVAHQNIEHTTTHGALNNHRHTCMHACGRRQRHETQLIVTLNMWEGCDKART